MISLFTNEVRNEEENHAASVLFDALGSARCSASAADEEGSTDRVSIAGFVHGGNEPLTSSAPTAPRTFWFTSPLLTFKVLSNIKMHVRARWGPALGLV